jgi:tetratricopeptide (TPR) repeat protein
LLKAIGNSYHGLGLNREAIPLLEQARELYAAVLGPEDIDTIDAMYDLAEAHEDTFWQDDTVEGLIQEILRVRKATLGPDNPDTFKAMNLLINYYSFRHGVHKCLPLLRELLVRQTTKLGAEHLDTLSTAAILANFEANEAWSNSKTTIAADPGQMFEKLLKRQRAELGSNHADTLRSMQYLAAYYKNTGQFNEAIPLWEELVKRDTAKLGSAHRETLISKVWLAWCYWHREATGEQLGRALRLLDEVLKVTGTEPAGKVLWEDEVLGVVSASIKLFKDKDTRSYNSELKHYCFVLAHFDDLFNQLAKLRPKETALWVGRGQYRALRGEWHQAASDLARVVRDRRLEDDSTFEYAGLLILDGDLTGYKKFCQELKARLEDQPNDPWVAFNVSRIMALAPNDAVEATRVMEWAQQAFNAHPDKGWVAHVLGLAQYRAGQNEAAIASLQKATALDWDGPVLDWLVQAMIHDRLGHAEEANRCIENAKNVIKVVKNMIKVVPSTPADDNLRFPCPDWIELNVLMREAEKLLQSTPQNHETSGTSQNGASQATDNKSAK